jgi:hypothetical protein
LKRLESGSSDSNESDSKSSDYKGKKPLKVGSGVDSDEFSDESHKGKKEGKFSGDAYEDYKPPAGGD